MCTQYSCTIVISCVHDTKEVCVSLHLKEPYPNTPSYVDRLHVTYIALTRVLYMLCFS